MSMLVVVTYDVSTTTKKGRRRLRRVAQACKNFGLRAQNSVFECLVDETQLAKLKISLLEEIDTEEDSLRFYFLDATAKSRIEHYGCKRPLDLEEPLVI